MITMGRLSFQLTPTGMLLLMGFLSSVGHLGAENAADELGWIWTGGNSVGNQPSVTAATLSGSDTTAHPGGRTGSATWKDRQGHLWLFGGKGFDDTRTNEPHCLADLWKFTASKEEWTLVMNPRKDLTTDSDSTTPVHRHVPKSRHSGVLCGVEGIILVLFGGEDATGKKLSDTWIFHVQKSSWVPVFMTPQSHSGSNDTGHPPPRMGCAHWCLEDKLIIFGGVGQQGDILGDMWQFSLHFLKWEKVEQFNQIKTFTVNNLPFPVARHGAATWVGQQGKLFMFAGSSNPHSSSIQPHEMSGFLSDMWTFDVRNQTWTFVSFESSSDKMPPPRQYASTFTKDGHSLWLYGGEVMNAGATFSTYISDLWVYNSGRNTWHFMGNNAAYVNQSIYYGNKLSVLKQVPITARSGAVIWWHKSVAFLFGGFGLDGRRRLSYLNDQWTLVKGDPTVYLTQRLKQQFTESWQETVSPGKIFLIVFCSFGAIVLLVGGVCFFKKMMERPKHGATSEFRVKYSKLRTDEPAL